MDEEISPDSSSAKRSQTTGHLLLHLPKAKSALFAPNTASLKQNGRKVEGRVGAANITTAERAQGTLGGGQGQGQVKSTQCTAGETVQGTEDSNTKRQDNLKHEEVIFEDDPDVPPLI